MCKNVGCFFCADEGPQPDRFFMAIQCIFPTLSFFVRQLRSSFTIKSICCGKYCLGTWHRLIRLVLFLFSSIPWPFATNIEPMYLNLLTRWKIHSIKYSLVRILSWHCVVAVWKEIAFGCLGVVNAQASWLEQVGRGGRFGREHVSVHGQTCKAQRLWALLLWFRHSAKNLNAQEERLATSS